MYIVFKEDLKILLVIKVEERKIEVNIKLLYDPNMVMYNLSREIVKDSDKML